MTDKLNAYNDGSYNNMTGLTHSVHQLQRQLQRNPVHCLRPLFLYTRLQQPAARSSATAAR